MMSRGMARPRRVGTLVRVSDGACVSSDLEVADTFWRRFRGLLGREGLEPGAGLLIEPCSSVHMFFMRFAIDVVYAKREGESELVVQKVVPDLGPWRLSACRGAHLVVELPAGKAASVALCPGDRLRFESTGEGI